MKVTEVPRPKRGNPLENPSPNMRRYQKWTAEWMDFLTNNEYAQVYSERYISSLVVLERYYATNERYIGSDSVVPLDIQKVFQDRIAARKKEKERTEADFIGFKEWWVAQDRERVLFYTLERPHRKELVFARFVKGDNIPQQLESLEQEYQELAAENLV